MTGSRPPQFGGHNTDFVARPLSRGIALGIARPAPWFPFIRSMSRGVGLQSPALWVFRVLQEHLDYLLKVSVELVKTFRLRMGAGEPGHITYKEPGIRASFDNSGKTSHDIPCGPFSGLPFLGMPCPLQASHPASQVGASPLLIAVPGRPVLPRRVACIHYSIKRRRAAIKVRTSTGRTAPSSMEANRMAPHRLRELSSNLWAHSKMIAGLAKQILGYGAMIPDS